MLGKRLKGVQHGFESTRSHAYTVICEPMRNTWTVSKIGVWRDMGGRKGKGRKQGFLRAGSGGEVLNANFCYLSVC